MGPGLCAVALEVVTKAEVPMVARILVTNPLPADHQALCFQYLWPSIAKPTSDYYRILSRSPSPKTPQVAPFLQGLEVRTFQAKDAWSFVLCVALSRAGLMTLDSKAKPATLERLGMQLV